jgi:hypothetical protein
MYHDRYGPTNPTLSRYLKEHFLQDRVAAESVAAPIAPTSAIEHRADTLFADRLAKPEACGEQPKKGPDPQ